MNPKVQQLLDEVRELSPLDKIELMNQLSHSLDGTANFWNPVTIDQLLKKQQVAPVSDIGDLAVDFWPEHESVDDFIAFVRQQRDEDQLEN